jgi:acyl carrier protein
MSRDQILRGVQDILRQRLAVERPVREEHQLIADLALDSMKQLTLVVELENHFAICFSPGAEQGVETVGDVVALIERALRDGT